MENKSTKSMKETIAEFTEKIVKNTVLVSVIVSWCTACILDLVYQVLTSSIALESGIAALVTMFFRVILIFAIAQGLWNGDVWAKWGALVLSLISAGISLVATLIIFSDPMKGLLMLVYVILYAYVAIQLLINKEAQSHFIKKTI